MRHKYLLSIIVLSLIIAFPATRLSAAETPETVIKNTTLAMLDNLSNHAEEYKKDPHQLYQAVETLVLPHFNMESIGRYVLGRHGKNATAPQVEAFTQEFKQQLLRTYASTLLGYSDEEVVFGAPINQPQKTFMLVLVPMEIKFSNGSSIAVTYFMREFNNHWQIIDIKIAESRIIKTFQIDYNHRLQELGIDKTIELMKQKNQLANS
jgi:phospholipid transport system substrate-binding protein